MNFNLLSIAVKSTIAAGTLSLLLLTSCEKASQEISPNNGDTAASELRSFGIAPGQLYEPNQVLVKFREGTSAGTRSRALEMISGDIVEKIHTATMKQFGDNEGLLVIKTPLA